jgi:hypothetical protein
MKKYHKMFDAYCMKEEIKLLKIGGWSLCFFVNFCQLAINFFFKIWKIIVLRLPN